MTTIALLLGLTLPQPNASLIPVNMACGIPPIPPVGCKIGDCVCDETGRCRWTFVCN
jgi:hypothetical protein